MKRASPRKLPFSQCSYQDSLENSPSSSTNKYSNDNGLMKPEEILKLIEDNAPPGYKHAITLVLKETDNIEKALKRGQTTSTLFSGKETAKGQKVSMDGAVLRCPKYQTKLKEQKKSKRRVGSSLGREEKIQRNSKAIQRSSKAIQKSEKENQAFSKEKQTVSIQRQRQTVSEYAQVNGPC